MTSTRFLFLLLFLAPALLQPPPVAAQGGEKLLTLTLEF